MRISKQLVELGSNNSFPGSVHYLVHLYTHICCADLHERVGEHAKYGVHLLLHVDVEHCTKWPPVRLDRERRRRRWW